MKVFLGGTCNGSNWREKVMSMLDSLGIEYFNPVVSDWSPEHFQEELKQRKECDICLYIITPKATGFLSIAEVVDDSNKRPKQTVFLFLEEDEEKTFTAAQLKSLAAVGQIVEVNGAHWAYSFELLQEYFELLRSTT